MTRAKQHRCSSRTGTWACAVWALALAAGGGAGQGRAGAQDTSCARRPLLTALLTPRTAPMPREGGALVAALRLGEPGTAAPAASFEGAAMSRRRTSLPLGVVALAPGLVRLVPSGPLSTGPWTVHGVGPDTEITVGRAALPGAPVRPAVHAMRRVAATGGAGSTPRTEIRAILDFPVPPGIVAMLVHWNGETSPSTWTRAVLARTEVVVYAEPDPCDDIPDGTRPPPETGPLTVSLAFVDELGQVSPISAPVAVD